MLTALHRVRFLDGDDRDDAAFRAGVVHETGVVDAKPSLDVVG
jgi:hypothetical protein